MAQMQDMQRKFLEKNKEHMLDLKAAVGQDEMCESFFFIYHTLCQGTWIKAVVEFMWDHCGKESYTDPIAYTLTVLLIT